MAVTANETDRIELNRARVAAILDAHLAGRPKNVVRVVDDLLPLIVETGRLHVGLSEDGGKLTFKFYHQGEFELPTENAKSVLRAMCANVATRVRGEDLPPTYGGVGYVPGPPDAGAGFTMTMMNTMDQYWFDLAWQGVRR